MLSPFSYCCVFCKIIERASVGRFGAANFHLLVACGGGGWVGGRAYYLVTVGWCGWVYMVACVCVCVDVGGPAFCESLT